MPVTEFIQSPPAYIASALLICTMITKGFGGVEKFLTDEARDAIYSWIVRPQDPALRHRWPAVFSHVLDRVFGASHWSLPSFWRSAFVSCLVLTFLTLLGTAFNQDLMHMVRWNFKAMFLLFLCNVVADYLSIGKARFLIRRMSRVSSTSALLLLLVIDVILSIALFYYAFLIFELLLHLRNPDRHTLSVVWQALKRSTDGFGLFLGSRANDAWFGVFIFTTLTTSAWAFLFLITNEPQPALRAGRA